MSSSKYDTEKNLLRKVNPIELSGSIVAGGTIRDIFLRRYPKDIDLYFKTRIDYEDAISHMFEDRGATCVFASKRAVTFNQGNKTFQLMHFNWFPSATQVFESFDFTVCMGGYDYDAGEFVLHEDFLPDLAKRQLRFNHKSPHLVSSLLRVHKFQKQGFSISKRDLIKLALACSQMQIKTWDDLEMAVGGFYGEELVRVKDKTQAFTLKDAFDGLEDMDDMKLQSPIDGQWLDVRDVNGKGESFDDLIISVTGSHSGKKGNVPLKNRDGDITGWRWPTNPQEVFKYCL